MKFLIQTIDNKIVHDFSFVLLEAIRFHEWKGTKFDYVLSDTIINDPIYIPIGSVEFVTEFVKNCHNIDLKPINIPIQLFDFAGRIVFNGTETNIFKTKMFVKSNDKIKYFTEIVEPNTTLPKGNYQYSLLVDIVSEYRCFVYQNKLVGIQNYSGEFTVFPNIREINLMIEAYTYAPVAYTLDVGVLNNGDTVVIEVHDFYSCGLYGFSNLKLLPFMFTRWFNENVINKR